MISSPHPKVRIGRHIVGITFEVFGINVSVTEEEMEELRWSGSVTVSYTPENPEKLEDMDNVLISRLPNNCIGITTYHHGAHMFSPWDPPAVDINTAIHQYSFKKGMLYFRIEDEFIGHLFYAINDVSAGYSEFRCMHIAEARPASATGPYFSVFTDYTQFEESTGAGIVIKFKRATDQDLATFLRKWGSTVTLDYWLHNVDKLETLIESEKMRLRQIIKDLPVQ